jgi:hypothetical protein
MDAVHYYWPKVQVTEQRAAAKVGTAVERAKREIAGDA